MSLSFHQTFSLDCDNLARLLVVVKEHPFATNLEIHQATGIGIGKDERKGKVQPTIDYAIYGGLLALTNEGSRRKLRLTDVGKIVIEKDEWIKKTITQWVLHYHLSREKSEAEVWAFFVQEFLSSYREFERATFENALIEKFGQRAKLKSINPSVTLNSYLDGNSLGRIGLIRELSKNKYARAQPYIPNAHIVAYILAEIWENKNVESLMIEPSTLLERYHLATTMCIAESDLQYWLNMLSSLSIITQMREARPYQVVCQWNNKYDLLKKAYEEG